MDKELLNAIREELSPMRQDINELKQDVIEIRQELSPMRQDIDVLKQDVIEIRQELSPMRQDIDVLKQDVIEIRQDVNRLTILMEHDIPKQINLLAEGQRMILDRLPKRNETEELSGRVDTLETVVTTHSADIAKLKKAL
jgi:uncharacterized coiled-coil DUF342 family protein